MDRLEIRAAKEIAKKRSGKCLSKVYVNARSLLSWECKVGHRWNANYDHVRRGQWCPGCAKNQKLSIDECKKIAMKRGGMCLSNKYVNSRTKLEWQCQKAHRWQAAPYSTKSGRWCLVCSGHEKLDLDEMDRVAISRGGKCLSKLYKNARSKLIWQCGQSHVWKAKPVDIKRGTWCPVCSEHIGEKICRVYFEQLLGEKFPKSHPVWLKNQEGNSMELDGYSKKLSIAFEHQGRQHYDRLQYWQEEKDFIKRRRDDKEKIRLCRENGVLLIVVPELLRLTKIDNFKEFLAVEFRKNGVKFNSAGNIRLDSVYTPSAVIQRELIEKIVKKQAGTLLSEIYIGAHNKLRLRCSEGHTWEASPSNIKAGKWCRKCAFKIIASKRRKYDIEDMKKIARKKDGECLSKKYENSNSKLEWKCKNGHIWRSDYEHIKRDQWCSLCKKI